MKRELLDAKHATSVWVAPNVAARGCASPRTPECESVERPPKLDIKDLDSDPAYSAKVVNRLSSLATVHRPARPCLPLAQWSTNLARNLRLELQLVEQEPQYSPIHIPLQMCLRLMKMSMKQRSAFHSQTLLRLPRQIQHSNPPRSRTLPQRWSSVYPLSKVFLHLHLLWPVY